ncbi:MAG: sulfatase [Thermoleophilaceae bacterium]|nr:sulfatase [Thermoleophilaceae bacterium]
MSGALGGGGELTRRRFLELGGGAAGAALLGPAGDALLGATPRAKNVVVVVLDNVRADYLASRRVRTPNLDTFARESLSFTRYRPEAFPTIPARRTIMTGRRIYPFRGWDPTPGLPQEPGWQPIARSVPVFTDLLERAGYRTGYVTDNPHILSGAYDPFRARFTHPVTVKGQVPFRGKPRDRTSRARLERHALPPLLRDKTTRRRIEEFLNANFGRDSEEDYLAPRVFTAASRWVAEAAASQRPFALVVDSFDPHEPWDPPDRYLRMYGKGRFRGIKPIQPFFPPGGRIERFGLTPTAMRSVRNLYKAELTMVDAWFGRFLAGLDRSAVAGDTVVMVLSDHGVLLGEHGQVGKAPSQMYREVTDVPLIIRDPQRRRAGRSTAYRASTHDIAPTALSYLGRPVPDAMDGVDLSLLFAGKRPPRRETFTSSYGAYVSAGDDRWLLISDNQGKDKRLFDTRRDPGEHRDVAAQHPEVVRRLWRLVLRDAGGKRLPNFN